MIKTFVKLAVLPVLVGGICILYNSASKKETPLNLDNYSTEGLELVFDHPKTASEQPENFEYYTPFPDVGNAFLGFKEAVAFKESQGNYFAVNTYGYMGKYQFGKATLDFLGIKDPHAFLQDPALQEKVFVAYTERNKWVLRRDIKRYQGQYINGIHITESGILAAAHLVGAGSVKKYLRSQGEEQFVDGYGTSIESYLKNFSGYEMTGIEAVRTPDL